MADSLSRRDAEAVATFEEASLLVAVSQLIPDILELLRADVRSSPELKELLLSIENGTAPKSFTHRDGLIFRDNQIIVAADSTAKQALLYEHHLTPTAGHPGAERTLRRLASAFYWKGMRCDVKQFVASCFDCQTTKYSTQKPAGLLQPLPIPSQV